MEDRGGSRNSIFLFSSGFWGCGGRGQKLEEIHVWKGCAWAWGQRSGKERSEWKKTQNGLPHPSGFSYNTAPEIGRKLGMTLRMCMPEQGMPSVTPPNLLCVLCASALDPSAHWGVPGSLSILLAYCFQRVPKPPPRRGSYVDDSPKPNFLSDPGPTLPPT